MNYKPLIIVGAPRSGTNMLRDVLTSLDEIGTWPCDEINYIWRHGNVRYPSDELTPKHATHNIKKYIRRKFTEIAKNQYSGIVVEKTCANTLRIPFVDAVFPGARYIYIYRDGMDVVGSASLRWTAKLDIPYLFAKVRYVPKIDLPYYAIRYFGARIYRLFSRERRLSFWGPSLNNMQEILQSHSLNEICALQWQRCVDKADEALSELPEGKVLRVCYENFVREPVTETEKILTFIGCEVPLTEIEKSVSAISSNSIGKGRNTLDKKELEQLEALVKGSLKRYDYL